MKIQNNNVLKKTIIRSFFVLSLAKTLKNILILKGTVQRDGTGQNLVNSIGRH